MVKLSPRRSPEESAARVVSKMSLALPRFTADGLLDYMGLAIGLTIGFSLLRPVGEQVQTAISKR